MPDPGTRHKEPTMPVRVPCPSCSAVLNLPDSVRGKAVTVTCKKCGTRFPVKSTRPATSAVKANPPSGKPRPRPAAAFDFDDDRSTRRPARKASGGGALKWLLIGGLGGGALVGLGVVLFFVLRTPEDPNKKLADDLAREFKDLSKGLNPKDLFPQDKLLPQDKQPGPPGDDKKPLPQDKPPDVTPRDDKKPPEKDDKRPPEQKVEPGPKDPQTPAPIKASDGARILVTHPQRNLRFLGVSPDGKSIYTASWDEQFRAWDANTLALKGEMPLPKPDVVKNTRLRAALSDDGKTLVFAHWDVLQALNLDTKKVEPFEGMPKEEHGLGRIRLSADGTTALTNWDTVSFALWRVPERKFVAKLRPDGVAAIQSGG